MNLPFTLTALFLTILLAATPQIYSQSQKLPLGPSIQLSFDKSKIAKKKSLTLSLGNGARRIYVPIAHAKECKGIVGEALRFDNDKSIVLVGYPSALRKSKSVSVSAWVNIKELGESNYIVSQEDWADGKTRGYSLRVNSDGQAEFSIGNQGWKSAKGAEVPLRKWVHLVGTADENTVTLWLNGEQVSSEDSGGGIQPSPYILTIGRGNYDEKRGYHGDIDEVIIYNRALKKEEIESLHTRAKKKLSVQPYKSSAKKDAIWPADLENAIKSSLNGLEVCKSKTGDAIVVVNRIEDFALIKYGSNGLLKPIKIKRPSKTIEQGLAPQKITAAIDSKGYIHIVANYLGWLAQKPNHALHGVFSSRGKSIKKWSSINKAAKVNTLYRLPQIVTDKDGKLNLVAIGESIDKKDAILTASLSSKGLSSVKLSPISHISKQRFGGIARSVAKLEPKQNPILLTDQKTDLMWVKPKASDPTPCMPKVRALFESSYLYNFHVSQKGEAFVVSQRPSGDATIGEETIDLASLYISKGSAGIELSKPIHFKFGFVKLAEIAFVESDSGDVYLIVAAVDFETALPTPYRIGVYKLTGKTIKYAGSAGYADEVRHLSGSFTKDKHLVIAGGGLGGGWALKVKLKE